MLQTFSLLILLCLQFIGICRCANVTFVTIWDSPEAVTDLKRIFTNSFQSHVTAECPAKVPLNFTFLSVNTNNVNDVNKFNALSSSLSPSPNTFTLWKDAAILEVLRSSSSIPSAPRQLMISPMPANQITAALLRVINQRIAESLNPTHSHNSRAALFVQSKNHHSSDDWQELRSNFKGGCIFFTFNATTVEADLLRVRAADVVNIVTVLPKLQLLQLMRAAVQFRLLSFRFRWFMFSDHLTDSEVASLNIRSTHNMTSLTFGRRLDTEKLQLWNGEQVLLSDGLTAFMDWIKDSACNESKSAAANVSALTGQFTVTAAAVASRREWNVQTYRGIGGAAVQIGFWSSTGKSKQLAAKDPPRTIQMALSELMTSPSPLRIVTVPYPPYVIVSGSVYSGMYIDLCRRVMQHLGIANFQFFVQPDGAFGAATNGSWNGLVQTVLEGRADLACAPITISAARKRVVSFSQVVHSSRQSILFRKIVSDPILTIFQFVQPLHWEIWATTFAALIVVALAIYFSHKMEPNPGVKFDLYNSVFFAFAEIVQGSTGDMPRRASGRIVVTFFWFFSLFLLLAYIANYAAFRTLDGTQLDVTSLQTLLQNRDFEIGGIRNTVTASLLQSSVYITLQQAYSLMTDIFPDGFVDSVEQAVAIVSNSSRKYALINDNLQNQYYRDINCDLISTGEFYEINNALMLPKDSEILPAVNSAIANLSAVIAQLRVRYFTVPSSSKPNCHHTSLTSTIQSVIPPEPWPVKQGALTLVDTMGIAMINLIGCCLALVISAIERGLGACLDYLSRRRRQKQFEIMEEVADQLFAS